MPQSIDIISVGRSGSKLFQIVVSYLLAQNKKPLQPIYEPLLWSHWDSSKLNEQGLALHQKIPLLTDSANCLHANEQRFFKEMGLHEEITYVCKMIRMTGRLGALREMRPSNKCIFSYRSPTSVIRSIMGYQFSFLGAPHYKSDLHKLHEETLALGFVTQSQINSLAKYAWGDELLYWYANHKMALQRLKIDHNIFVTPFEAATANPTTFLRALCNYLDVPYHDHYMMLMSLQGNTSSFNEIFVRNRWERVVRKRPVTGRLCKMFLPEWRYKHDISGVLPPSEWKENKRDDSSSSRYQLSDEETAFIDNFCSSLVRNLNEIPNPWMADIK